MELDITEFFNESAPMDYSASVAEIGEHAGTDTWHAACEDSDIYPILHTDAEREAFRDFVKGFGAWSAAEIYGWSNTQLNALCIQYVAGDMREADLHPNMSDAEWCEYEERVEQGDVAGRIFRGVDGRVYFYCGN